MVNRKDAVKSPEVLQHLSLCAPDPTLLSAFCMFENQESSFDRRDIL